MFQRLVIALFTLLLTCILCVPSTALGNFVIFQTADGHVIVLGQDDVSEIISVERESSNTLHFFAYSLRPDGFVDTYANTSFSDVTGIYVDFGEGVANTNQRFRLGVSVGQNAGSVLVDGSVEVYCSDQDSSFFLTTGSDAEIAGDLIIDSTAKADTIIVDSTWVAGSVDIRSRDGDDTLRFSDLLIGGDLSVKSGNGDDVLDLDGLQVLGRLDVQTGRSNDEIEVQSSWIGGSTAIDLGRDSDEVLILNTRFGIYTTIDAGSGVDEGNEGSNIFGKARLISGFEFGNMN